MDATKSRLISVCTRSVGAITSMIELESIELVQLESRIISKSRELKSESAMKESTNTTSKSTNA